MAALDASGRGVARARPARPARPAFEERSSRATARARLNCAAGISVIWEWCKQAAHSWTGYVCSQGIRSRQRSGSSATSARARSASSPPRSCCRSKLISSWSRAPARRRAYTSSTTSNDTLYLAARLEMSLGPGVSFTPAQLHETSLGVLRGSGSRYARLAGCWTAPRPRRSGST